MKDGYPRRFEECRSEEAGEARGGWLNAYLKH
jgi:hypothetical protein